MYVEDGRIRAVVPAGSEGIKTDADEVIDAEGKTLIPGLFEMHAHLYGFIFNPYELQCMTAGKIIFGALDFANEYLRQGFTTIRIAEVHITAQHRSGTLYPKVSSKRPRIVSCGLIVTPTETGNDTFSDLYAEADGPEEMRKACRRELQKGNDFIKLMVSGAFMNEGQNREFRLRSRRKSKRL